MYGKLSELGEVEALRGSFVWLDKFSWLAPAFQFIISAFCIVGICAVVFSTMVTIVYFSMRSLWDTVHKEKNEYIGKSAFGVPSMLQDTWGNKHAVGIDAIIHLVLVFLPDIKAIGEMSETSSDYGDKLNEDDSIVTWFLKTTPTKIAIIFCLSMGWNGSLLKCFFMVTDGLGVVADRVASANSEEFVNNILNAGDHYKFSFSDKGTNIGNLQQTMAESTYNQVVAALSAGDRTAPTLQAVGAKIEGMLTAEGQALSPSVVKQKLKASYVDSGNTSGDWEVSDEDMKYAKVSVVKSGTNQNGTNYVSVPLTQIVNGSTQANGQYLTYYFTLKRRASANNLLRLPSQDNSGTTNQNNNGGTVH